MLTQGHTTKHVEGKTMPAPQHDHATRPDIRTVCDLGDVGMELSRLAAMALCETIDSGSLRARLLDLASRLSRSAVDSAVASAHNIQQEGSA